MSDAENEVIEQFTIRLPESLLSEARRIARRRRQSVNAVIRTALRRFAREDRQAMLRASYELLGSDRDDSDAEYFLAAQHEVLEGGE